MAKQTKLRPYLSNLTAKGYSSLFTGKGEKSDKVKLCLINEKYLDELNVSQEGRFSYKNDWLRPVNFEKILKPIAQSEIDLPLMQAVYSVFYQSVIDGKSSFSGNTLAIKRSVLTSYIGVRTDTYHHTNFMERLGQFNNVFGYFGSGKVKKFLTFIGYEPETDELEFDVALLCEIVNTIYTERAIKVKKPFKKEFIQELPSHSFLIHSNISRKNKNAYFLVTQIEVLLVQAGEKVKNPHIRFDTLIQRVPSLWAVLESDIPSKDKNNYLTRAFTKMYSLLENYTDLYEYFVELHIPKIIPTQTGLNKVLQITHKGINNDYRQK